MWTAMFRLFMFIFLKRNNKNRQHHGELQYGKGTGKWGAIESQKITRGLPLTESYIGFWLSFVF